MALQITLDNVSTLMPSNVQLQHFIYIIYQG